MKEGTAAASSVAGYAVRIQGHEMAGDHVVYLLLVSGPGGKQWELKQRYSRMRALHDELKHVFNAESLALFPTRKLFGRTNKKFLSERQAELQQYFNRLLSLDPTCKTKILQNFFEFHKNGQTDTANALNFSDAPNDPNKGKKTIESILSHSSNLMIDLSRSFRYNIDHAIIRSRTQRHMKILNSAHYDIFPNKNSPSPQHEQQSQTTILNTPLDVSIFSLSQPPTLKSLACPPGYNPLLERVPYQLSKKEGDRLSAHLGRLCDCFPNHCRFEPENFVASFDFVAAESN